MGIFDRFLGPAESSKTGSGAVDVTRDQRQEDVSGDGKITFFEPRSSIAATKEEVSDLGGYPLGSEALLKASILAAHRDRPMSKSPVSAIPDKKESIVFDFRSGKPREAVSLESMSGAISIPVVEEAATIAPIEPVAEETVATEAQAVPEGEDAETISVDVGIGQVWRCADAAFRVDNVAGDGQSISIIFTEGQLTGEQQTFSIEGFADFIGDKEFAIVPEEASEESLRQATDVMERGEREKSNPLVRPVMKLFGEARMMAEKRQDGTMLTYLAENDDLIESLARKRRLENAEIGLLKDVRERLEGYLSDIENPVSAPPETDGGAEQDKREQEDPMGEFRDRVSRYADEINDRIIAASDMSALGGIGVLEEQPIKGSVITLRKFVSDEGGEFFASVASVKPFSKRDAMKKVLHDADRALRKAWHRKESELRTNVKKEERSGRPERKPRDLKGSAPEQAAAAKDERPKKKPVKKPKRLDTDDAVRDAMNSRQDRNPFDVDDAAREFADNQGGKSTPKRRERKATLEKSTPEQESAVAYEKLERAAEEDGAYHTVLGAIAAGLRMMKEAVPGIEKRKDELAGRIAEAIALKLEHPIAATGERLGWSTDETALFAREIVRKGIEKFLK